MQEYPLYGNKKELFLKRLKLRLKLFYQRIKFIFINDFIYTKYRYKKNYKEELNLNNPKTFTEKLLFLKLFYRNPLQIICTDKYYVKEYIKLCGLERILKKNYGIFNTAEKIDFKTLPEKFFLKTNHRSGFNYLVDKNIIDEKHTKKLFSILLKSNYYYGAREWAYKDIKPKIICEEILSNRDKSPLLDYKFYCFSGEPKYFMVSQGEYEHDVKNHKFDMELNSIDHYFKKTPSLDFEKIHLPDNINDMIEIVKILCKPFPHVRVDLYNIDGRIVFGELTFYSNAGFVNIESKKYNEKIGSWIKLEDYVNDIIIRK